MEGVIWRYACNKCGGKILSDEAKSGYIICDNCAAREEVTKRKERKMINSLRRTLRITPDEEDKLIKVYTEKFTNLFSAVKTGVVTKAIDEAIVYKGLSNEGSITLKHEMNIGVKDILIELEKIRKQKKGKKK
jgi:reverse gyrase